MGAFVIQIGEIQSKGQVDKEFRLSSAWLTVALEDTEFDAPEAFDAPLKIVARSVMDDVLVEGTFTAELQAPCSRCGEPVPVVMAGSFTQLLTSGEQELPEELELTPEDLERDTYSGDEITLDRFVREFILLEVPMSPHCEGGCADPEVRRILRLGDDGQPLPNERPKGALSALSDLAAQLKKKEED